MTICDACDSCKYCFRDEDNETMKHCELCPDLDINGDDAPGMLIYGRTFEPDCCYYEASDDDY